MAKMLIFVLFSSDVSPSEIKGSVGIAYKGSSAMPILVTSENDLYIANSSPLNISENVDLKNPQDSIHGPQFLLNHEAGHFLYMVRNTAQCINFRQNQLANHIDNDGGHKKMISVVKMP